MVQGVELIHQVRCLGGEFGLGILSAKYCCTKNDVALLLVLY